MYFIAISWTVCNDIFVAVFYCQSGLPSRHKKYIVGSDCCVMCDDEPQSSERWEWNKNEISSSQNIFHNQSNFCENKSHYTPYFLMRACVEHCQMPSLYHRPKVLSVEELLHLLKRYWLHCCYNCRFLLPMSSTQKEREIIMEIVITGNYSKNRNLLKDILFIRILCLLYCSAQNKQQFFSTIIARFCLWWSP